MHELSLIASLFDIIEKKADEKKAKKILSVKLQVGIFSGAVPELLISAFDIYKKDTLAREAEITCEKVLLKMYCKDCGVESTSDDYILACSKCHSSNLKTVAGTELILERIEMEI